MNMRHIILWPIRLYHISPLYLINGTIFGEKLLTAKYAFWFSLKLSSETFLILTRTQRDTVTKVHVLSIWITPYSCHTLTLWSRNYFFNLSTPVYKMWIIQEPNKLPLWNKLYFEEKKNREYRACLKYSVLIFVE